MQQWKACPFVAFLLTIFQIRGKLNWRHLRRERDPYVSELRQRGNQMANMNKSIFLLFFQWSQIQNPLIFNLDQFYFTTCDTLSKTSFTNIFWSQNPENENYKIFCLLRNDHCDVISRCAPEYFLQTSSRENKLSQYSLRWPSSEAKRQKVVLGNVFAARIIASEEFRNLSLVHIFPFKVPGRGEIGPRGRLLCFGKTFMDGEKMKLL